MISEDNGTTLVPRLRLSTQNERSGFNPIFRAMDTYQGVLDDPITLHKYLYANDDPTKFVDPSGHDGITGLLVTMGITLSTFSGLISGSISALTAVKGHAGSAFVDGFARGFISTAITSAILIGTEGAAPLFFANTVGGGLSSLIVDIVEGQSVSKTIFDAAFSAGIGAVLGYAYGKAVPSAGEIAELFDGYNKALQSTAQKAAPEAFATFESNIGLLDKTIASMSETTAQAAKAISSAFLATAADQIINGTLGAEASAVIQLGYSLIHSIENIGQMRQGALDNAGS